MNHIATSLLPSIVSYLTWGQSIAACSNDIFSTWFSSMLERVGQWCSGARHTAVCKSLSNLHPGFLLELSDKS